MFSAKILSSQGKQTPCWQLIRKNKQAYNTEATLNSYLKLEPAHSQHRLRLYAQIVASVVHDMGPGLDFTRNINHAYLAKKRITERVVGSLSVESGLAASYIHVHDINHHVVPKSMQLQTVLFRPS